MADEADDREADASFPRDGGGPTFKRAATYGHSTGPIRFYTILGPTQAGGPGIQGILWCDDFDGIGFDAMDGEDDAAKSWRQLIFDGGVARDFTNDVIFRYWWDRAATSSWCNVGAIRSAPSRAAAIRMALEAPVA